MTSVTTRTIKEILDPSLCPADVYKEYRSRIAADDPTRDENTSSHFCVYFFPYNPDKKEVFIIHHKKSGKWLSPGGHIDKGETVAEALKREIREELGFDFNQAQGLKPFLLTITPIDNQKHPCKRHFDIWFGVETDGACFNVDPREFLATKWLTIAEARKLVTDEANIQALYKIEQIFSNTKS